MSTDTPFESTRQTLEIESITLNPDNMIEVGEWLRASSFAIEFFSQHKMGMPGFEYVPKHVIYQRPGGKLFVKFDQTLYRAVGNSDMMFIGRGNK